MSNPTRLTKQSVAGKANLIKNGLVQNRGDYALTTKSFVLPIVASATAQSTGIILNPGVTYCVTLNVSTEETTGLTKTVDVGFVGGTGQELLSGVSVATTGFRLAADHFNAIDTAQEISYTLGSADFVELDAEFVVTMVEANA